MEMLFTALTNALFSSPAAALAASFAWGVLSVVLSPCHLASIPLIVGFIDRQGAMSPRRAFTLSALFSLGILVTIALVGLATGLAGRILGDVGQYGRYAVAVLFIVVGLNLMDIIPMPFSGAAQRSQFQNKGALAAFALGLIFGVALGPCTFAYMAPMLGIVFSVAATRLPYALSLIVLYALGHCSVIVFAGTFTGLLQRYLNWNERSRGTVIVKRLCGGLVMLGGVYLMYIPW